MKRSVIRPRSLIALSFLAWLVLVACSKQEEGDRCLFENDNQDCESGLICVLGADLRGDEVDRCCPPEGSPVSDGRCTRLDGGSTGGGNEGGEGGQNTTSTTGGAAQCSYHSQCAEGLRCGPLGTCQAECLTDRDCEGVQICAAGRCVPGGSAGDNSGFD